MCGACTGASMRFVATALAAAVAAAAAAPPPRALTYIVGPSAARVALNGALRGALGCDGGGAEQPTLSAQAAEQCALTDFDTPALHGVFRQRRVLHDWVEGGAHAASVTTLVTADTPAALRAVAAQLRSQRDAGEVVALVPAAWAADDGGVRGAVDRVWTLPDSPVAAVAHARAQLATLTAEVAGDDAAAEAARRLAGGGGKPAAGGGAKKQKAAAAAGGAPSTTTADGGGGGGGALPPSWAAWLALSPRTQLAALVALALAAIALHKAAWHVLDECEKRLAGATGAAGALELRAQQAAADAASAAKQAAALADAEASAGGGGAGNVPAAASAATADEVVISDSSPLMSPGGGVSARATAGASAAAAAAAAAATQEPGAPSAPERAKAAAELRAAWLRTAVVTGGLLAFLTLVNVVCDRWRWFPLLTKQREVGTDVFWAFMAAACLVACYLGVGVSERDGEVLMGVRQTEEAKGWMMLGFLVYHWWDVKSTYNLIRVLVSAYVFLTGYGNTVSLSSKPPTLAKYASSFLRINLLVTCVSVAMGQDYMLYYICGLHTFWTAYVYLLHATLGGGSGGATRVPKVYRYALAIGVNTVLWHWPSLFNLVFAPLTPLLTYNGSMYEVRGGARRRARRPPAAARCDSPALSSRSTPPPPAHPPTPPLCSGTSAPSWTATSASWAACWPRRASPSCATSRPRTRTPCCACGSRSAAACWGCT